MSIIKSSIKTNKRIINNIENANENNLVDEILTEIGTGAIQGASLNNGQTKKQSGELQQIANDLENEARTRGVSLFDLATINSEFKEKLQQLPANKEYFFLSDLKSNETKIKTENDLLSLAAKYQLNPNDVDLLGRKGLIINHNSFGDFTSKFKNGFISKINANEERFLKRLIKENPEAEDSAHFKKIQQECFVDEKSLARLKSNGHLFILKSKERDWVESGMKSTQASNYNINCFRLDEIVKNMSISPNTITVKTSPIRHKNFIVKYSESDSLLSYRSKFELGYEPNKTPNSALALLGYEKNRTTTPQRLKDKYYELKSAGITLGDQDRSDIMTILISSSPEKYLSESKIKNLSPLISGTFTPETIKAQLISNKEFFFLMNLKEYETSEDFSIEAFAKKHEINSKTLDKLKQNKLIVQEEINDTPEILCEKGLLYLPSKQENDFLNYLNSLPITPNEDEILPVLDKFNLTTSNLYNLKRSGNLIIIKPTEEEWIKAGADLKTVSQFGISEYRAKQIIARHLFEGGHKSSIAALGIKKIRNFKINYSECDELIKLRSLNKISDNFISKDGDSKLILKAASEGIEGLNNFERPRYYELLSNGRGLSLQDYADVLALEMNDLYSNQFPESRLNYVQLVQQTLKEYDLEKYKKYRLNLEKVLPNNNEYFFLAELRTLEFKGITKEELYKKGVKQFNLSENQIEKLERERFFEIDSSDGSMSKRDRVFKGFLSLPSENEIKFLRDISENKCFLNDPLLNELQDKHRIDDLALSKLISNRHLYILSKEQHEMIIHGVSLSDWVNAGHNKYSYFFYQKSLKENGDLSANYINTKAISSKKLIVNYKEKESVLQHRTFLQSSYAISERVTDTPLLIKAEFEGVDSLSYKEKERYYELLSQEIKLNRENIPSIDELMFLKKLNGRVSQTQNQNDIIDNLRTQDFIKETVTLDMEKRKEFFEKKRVIKTGRIQHFKNIGLITSKEIDSSDGVKTIYETHWQEPKCLTDARVFFISQKIDHNFKRFENYINDLNNKFEGRGVEKFEQLKNLLDQKTLEYGIVSPSKFEAQSDNLKKLKMIDYGIYVKENLGGSLTPKEKDRLAELKLCGLDPKLEINQEKFIEKHNSFRMKDAQNLAFNKKFVELTGLKPEHIKFVNSFKQVSESDLIRIGISKDLIKRLSEGVSCKALGNKIEIFKSEQTVYEDAQVVNYYSIQHLGTVSGRSILETYYPDVKIEKQSQNRKDLINHDLKVVTAVLNIKEELEHDGYVIKEMKNESTQYSENKMGLANDQRNGGPSYMDAILIVDSQESLSQAGSGGSSSKVVAVEYGNYSTARMQAKIDNSIFDEAYVFANEQYIQKYQNKIVTNKVVHYRTL